MINPMQSKVWDDISYRLPDFNDYPEVYETFKAYYTEDTNIL